jgi:signal transduction histidine kinase/ActR/RegA family two-component response regulator
MWSRVWRYFRAGPVIAVMALCGLGTGSAWQLVSRVDEHGNRTRFQTKLSRGATRVRASLDKPLALLRGMSAFFVASEFVDPEEWRVYTHTVSAGQNYPGLIGMVYIEPEGRESRGIDDGDTGLYARVRYVDPPEQAGAVGHDAWIVPEIAAALRSSCESGYPRISALGERGLLSGEGPQTCAFSPIFRRGEPADTPEQRWAALQGWVGVVLRSDSLMAAAMGPVQAGVVADVYDGPPRAAGRRMFASGGQELADGRMDDQLPVSVPGHTWTLRLRTTPAFFTDGNSRATAETLAIGCLISALVVGVTAWVSRARAAAVAMGEALRVSEREAQRSRAAAEDANAAKDRFLATMSHELRTPMAAILGHAELVQDPQLEPQQRLESARTIRTNGEHLLRIINDILDLSKIESGSMSVERVPCSPVQIVEDVVSLLRVRARPKGVELAARYAFPLPGCVQTDPVRLRQILLNIVGNAVKFTQQGSVQVSVRLEKADAGSQMVFEVRDTGVGIDAEKMPALFKSFSQGDASTTRRFGGTGLGLVIAQKMAGMLGGQIHAVSSPGMGSIFTFVLPVGAEAQEEPVYSLEEALRQGEQTSLPADLADLTLCGRILLAEDGVENQRLLKFWLNRAGAQVDLAEDGLKAVQMMTAALNQRRDSGRPYDLVLMDVHMPELDGYAATARMREHGYRGPILALTAFSGQGEREKCIAAGCDDFLCKPVARQRLLGVCRAWLTRPNTEHALAA